MAAPPRGDRWLAPVALVWLVVSLGIFAAFAVPRLTNNAIGDLEFSGWSGAVGQEFQPGRAPYSDFVLPIPPGSLALLAWIHRLAGSPRLLHELGLIAVCQIAMAVLAYPIARPFTTRLNAILVSFASAVTLLRGLKECAYDHTASLVAWGAVACLAQAAFLRDSRRREFTFAAAGVLAILTLLFKQSTATGVLCGSAAFFALLALRNSEHRRDALRGAAAFAAGTLMGGVLLWAILALLHAPLADFVRATFGDAPVLKGGSRAVLSNLGQYLLGAPAFPASLLLLLCVGFVLERMVRSPGGMHLGLAREEPSPRAHIAVAVALGTVGFAVATLLLVLRVPALPPSIAYWTDRFRFVPGFGLLVGCLSAVAHLVSRGAPTDADVRFRGHVMTAVALAALGVSLMHNLSSPEFRPFYDPNPIVPLAFAFLYGAFDRARLPRAKLGVFALSMAALFSPKLDRALEAQTPIGKHGYFGGLFVNDGATPFVKAALRARELTREQDTVMVLPEDLEIRGLVGRPRPPLTGAVVFVDQYAPRLLERDLATLEHELPKVVVVRPAERELWIVMFALWNNHSASRALIERFLDDWLPRRYHLDSTFATRYGERSATLELWVRND